MPPRGSETGDSNLMLGHQAWTAQKFPSPHCREQHPGLPRPARSLCHRLQTYDASAGGKAGPPVLLLYSSGCNPAPRCPLHSACILTWAPDPAACKTKFQQLYPFEQLSRPRAFGRQADTSWQTPWVRPGSCLAFGFVMLPQLQCFFFGF